MSKGLKVTLMTVAVAMIAVQAMAMAPLIKDIPSPVVSDIEDSTPANNFVYPDAINLANYVSDDTSPAASIIWSFQGGSNYQINGHVQLPAGNDGIDPGTYAINTSVVGGEVNPDGNPATLTIRNSHLSPVVGAQGIPIDGDQTQLVTFYASDGTTASVTGTMHASGVANGDNVWFYTTHDAALGDHLTPSGPQWDTPPMDERTFPGNASGFTWGGGSGSCTSSTDSRGICINVQPAGDNVGKWVGPFGMITLTAHKVYRLRATVTGTQAALGPTADGDVPLWDMIINNFNAQSQGMNMYGMNFFFLDNVGHANAAISGEHDFTAYWCPSPISATRTGGWNDPDLGVFAPQNANYKDSFVEFRILDTGAGIKSELRTGSLCLSNLVIETIDDTLLGSSQVVATPYNLDPVTDAGSNVTGSGYTSAYGAEGCTLTPTAAGQSDALMELKPGDGNTGGVGDYADDYPVALEAQKLYLISMSIDAPSGATNPPDVFWVGAEAATNELICLTYVTASGFNAGVTAFTACAMPGTEATTYKALFYTNFGSNVDTAFGIPQLKVFRPRFMMGNNTALTFTSNASSAIRVRSMKVDELAIP